ncbi:MAG: anaerobic ribonucleoside-triphosphate reductase activating protein [Lachnospiraceae bacterium]|nr:anaerobic ribonucleoside-triphosphate reductase activating protein [Lachnospiraceae bacterium]
MYYGEIKDCDIANGAGVRVTLFVSGCTNKCPGCFQPQTWAFDYGKPYTDETEAQILKMLEPSYIQGLTLLGGDPFEPRNQETVLGLARKVKALYPDKNIWCYTGFTYEELKTDGSYPRTECTDELLSCLDILVDGRFVQALKNISLSFRGSENQRIIDLNSTRKEGIPVVLDLDRKRTGK